MQVALVLLGKLLGSSIIEGIRNLSRNMKVVIWFLLEGAVPW